MDDHNDEGDVYREALQLHEQHRGKLEIHSKVLLENRRDLARAYTPGVAEVCRAIQRDRNLAYRYTLKGNSVAIVTDGTAVLGLGNIGPYAAIPVMEGKAILFKKFANIDAFPVCFESSRTDFVEEIRNIAPVFGGINLEDIAAPRCFEVEEALQDIGIPVMHDDQHGTAVVVLGGMLNAMKVTGRSLAETRVVINGAGASAIAVARLFLKVGVKDLILCDTKGIIYEGRAEGMNSVKAQMAKITNKQGRT